MEMTPKIGSALLEKNKLLEGKVFILESTLLKKIKEMKIDENKHLSKIEHLLQKLSETEAQLGKEKQLNLDIGHKF